MRYSVTFESANEIFPKSYHRLILFLQKTILSKYEKEEFYKKYEEKITNPKAFTFSTDLGECQFLQDKLIVKNKKFTVYYSFYDDFLGIAYYNSFLEEIKKVHKYLDNIYWISDIKYVPETTIEKEEMFVKAKSGIIVREHREKDNRKTIYHDISTDRGLEIFKENLKYQIQRDFENDDYLKNSNVEVAVIENKIVKVKFYNLVIPVNICKLYFQGDTNILKYIYLSGVSSLKSSGFSYFNIER